MALESTLESVDAAESLVLQIAQESGFEEEDLHKMGMSVREAMVNAVVHGNQYNRNKRVHLSVSAGGGKFKVRVADQGQGFDLSNIPDPLEDANLLIQSGRGIFLIRAFVDDFQVKRLEPHGTEVTLVKHLQQ